MKKLKISYSFIILTLCLYGCSKRNNLIGIYKWESSYTLSEALVMIKNDNHAIYKIGDKEPIFALWELSGDTLIVSSDNFAVDMEFVEVFPDTYFYMESSLTPSNTNGKLMPPFENATCEKFIIKNNGNVLVGIDRNTEFGKLVKTDLSEKYFMTFKGKNINIPFVRY